MSKARECCGWTAWFEMAGIDEDGRRVATTTGTVAAPDSTAMPSLANIQRARDLIGDADGRLAMLAVTVPDRPGNLARVTALVAAAGANVLQLSHARAFADISVRDVEIVMQLETRGPEHVRDVVRALEQHGFGVRQE